jgi:hypothetical protein
VKGPDDAFVILEQPVLRRGEADAGSIEVFPSVLSYITGMVLNELLST